MSAPVEIAVIGGGPAGAAAAAHLAAAGRDVLLFERAKAPEEKVCGAFLSGPACAELAALGVDGSSLGAVRISRLRLTARGEVAEAPLPFLGIGLSRSVLDAALLDRAKAAGADLRFGARVRQVAPAPEGVALGLDTGERILARRVLLATGKHDLPGRKRATGWTGREAMLALKIHLGLDDAAQARLGDAVEIHLFPGGYAGLQRIEGGAANLCMALSQSVHAEAGGEMTAILARLSAINPAFAEAIVGAVPAWPRPLAIARVPYGHLAASAPRPGEAWPLGDQAAVTPSFTGDGLAIALASGRIAADCILAGEDAGAFFAALRRAVAGQVHRAMRLQRLVDHPATHRAALLAARMSPGLLTWGARATRIRGLAEAA